MSWVIDQPGTFSTIQDSGRYHGAHLGLPVSGYMDASAAHCANRMVANPRGTTVIEVTWQGLSFVSSVACTVAVAGAEFDCEVNQQRVNTNAPVQLAAGDSFSMLTLRHGVRAYLSVHGGFDLPPFMGSQSTLTLAGLGGFDGRALQSGDELRLNCSGQVAGLNKPAWQQFKPQSSHVMRAMPGPEHDWFEPTAVRAALSAGFVLSTEANRQGFRLQNPAIVQAHTEQMISNALVPGTLQVTPDGQSILAMQDCQTTGGYPRLLVVNQSELHKAAQVRPGERIYFFVE